MRPWGDHVVAAVLTASTLALGHATVADAQTEVAVINQPAVSVPSPIPHARLTEFEAIPVPSRSTSPIPPLTLNCAGFTRAMFSIAAEVHGANSFGYVNAVLIPDVPFIKKAFEDDGIKLFPIHVGVETSGGDVDLFGAQPVQQALAFPRYLLYFENSGDRPVKAYLYVNLTN